MTPMKTKYFMTWPLALVVCGLLACGTPTVREAESPPDGWNAEHRLRAMSELLASAPSLRITTQEVHRWPNPEGDWSQLQATYELELWRPDALRITADGSGAKEIDHTLFYDGWTLTLESHAAKVFARAEVPPTVDEMLDEVAWRFDLPIPASDLLYSSPYEALMSGGAEGRFVGEELIGGRSCERFAFVGTTSDWEIWIESGDLALPCRLEIEHKDMEGPPRSEIVFVSVELAPELEESRFAFEPQEGYWEIPVVERSAPDSPPADGTESAPEAAAPETIS